MNTQERVEREINLIDLFWSILLGWRRIICFGILFAILLCGLKYFLDIRNYRAVQNIDVEAVKEELEEEELKQISDAVKLQERIDNYEKYQEKSAMMQIDPYAKPVLELQYRIQSDYVINYTKDSERDYTPELTSMYSNYIYGGEMAQKVIDEVSLPISKEDFVELVSVSGSRAQDTGSLFFTISYADEGKLAEIADVVKEMLQEKSVELQKVGSHELQLINESQSVVVDNALADKKNTISNSLITLESQLKSAKINMSEEQMALFNIEVSEMRGEELEEEEAPGIGLIYIILGGMIGAFLVCAWIACGMVFTSKLQSAEEMHTLYGIRLLGEVSVEQKRKFFLPMIDNWLLSLKSRGKKKLTPEQQLNVACMSLAISCKQQNIDTIYITGSEYENMDSMVLKVLKDRLEDKKIQVKDGENICYNDISMKQGEEIGNILLVEQTGKSVYDEISNEIQLMKDQNVQILGAIVLV